MPTLGLRRWQTNPESLATHGRRARAHRPIRRDEPRFAATRIQIRWHNDLLRVDAGDRLGQRSSRDMSATRRSQRCASPQVKQWLTPDAPASKGIYSVFINVVATQGRGYSGLLNRFRRRWVCFLVSALVLAVRNVDCRSSQLSRSPRQLSWQPTWLSSPPRAEHGVPVKDSAFSSPS
jgi:hypothetical protein